MKLALKTTLIISLLISFAVLLMFFAWAVNAVQFHFFPDATSKAMIDGLAQQAIARGEDYEATKALIEAKTLFIVLAGTLGWLSLYAGAFRLNQPLKEVSALLKIGLVLGVLAAVMFPIWWKATVVPVLAAALLALTWAQNAPNKQSQPSPQSGPTAH